MGKWKKLTPSHKIIEYRRSGTTTRTVTLKSIYQEQQKKKKTADASKCKRTLQHCEPTASPSCDIPGIYVLHAYIL